MSEGYQKPTFDFFGTKETQSHRNKKMSVRQEKKIAKTGQQGKLTPGSGNKGIKGDVWKIGRMYEAKVTEKKQIIVQLEWLKKLEREALSARKEPVFVLGFEQHSLFNTHWGSVPLERLEELYEMEQKYMSLLAELNRE